MLNYNESWIELNSKSLINNISELRNYACNEDTVFGGVLKGNAYGHGLVEVLKVVHDELDTIHVISIADAFKVREFEKLNALEQKRVLILSAISSNDLRNCIENNFEVVIYGPEWNSILKESKLASTLDGRKLLSHIHIDSGLGREGFLFDRVGEELDFINDFPDVVKIVGIMSHFANTEDVTDQEYARKQIENFLIAEKSIIKKFKLDSSLEVHHAASAASILMKDARFNAVRCGISLYGLWASDQTKLSAKSIYDTLPNLCPVLSWKCRSQVIKSIKSGSYIGYGCIYKCESDTKIAVFPVGYYDGYPRQLSGKAYVLVRGKRCQVLGRVMMNHIIVDISAIDTDGFDYVTATLIGTDNGEVISTEKVADWAQTINYELVTRIGVHLQRTIV